MVDQENFRLCQEVNIRFFGYDLVFHKPARTSRDVLHTRKVWFLILHEESTGFSGVGECAPIPGLSVESTSDVEKALLALQHSIPNVEQFSSILQKKPSIRFALETAIRDLKSGGKRLLFPHTSWRPIPINGLVWMNEIDAMKVEARKKIADGFHVVKLKVGAHDFLAELEMIRELRNEFPDIIIRLDANGAFKPEEALSRLNVLAEYGIHSIEQPIRQGQWKHMSALIKESPIPIALDEELIGMNDRHDKQKMLEELRPHFLILKPTLHGGMSGCDEWIELAGIYKCDWWATSALESSIGLNAIAQWVLGHQTSLPQGLGTGMLFENNLTSPWKIDHGMLIFDHEVAWDDKGLLLS